MAGHRYRAKASILMRCKQEDSKVNQGITPINFVFRGTHRVGGGLARGTQEKNTKRKKKAKKRKNEDKGPQKRGIQELGKLEPNRIRRKNNHRNVI